MYFLILWFWDGLAFNFSVIPRQDFMIGQISLSYNKSYNSRFVLDRKRQWYFWKILCEPWNRMYLCETPWVVVNRCNFVIGEKCRNFDRSKRWFEHGRTEFGRTEILYTWLSMKQIVYRFDPSQTGHGKYCWNICKCIGNVVIGDNT